MASESRKGLLDRYYQMAMVTLYASAATDYLSFLQLQTGLTTMQKVAWEVARVEYQVNIDTMIRNAATSADVLIGLTASGDITQTFYPNRAAIYDMVDVQKLSATTDNKWMTMPLIHQFYPGAELLVLPQNVWGFVKAAGLSAAATVNTQHTIRLWYREVELGPEDWYDLLQMRLPLGAVA